MTDELFETLIAVSDNKSITASQAQSLLRPDLSIGAMNNRLEDLRELGYLQRTRNGKEWHYSIKPFFKR